MPFCNLRNHWFIYCIILLCVCIAYYFQYLSWPEVISESDDVLSIDLEDPDFNSIFIGAMTKSIQGTVTSLEPLSIKNSWKKLDLFLLNVQSICKQTSMPVLKKWCYYVFDISSFVWKIPSYVRWIVCVNAKVPKGHTFLCLIVRRGVKL